MVTVTKWQKCGSFVTTDLCFPRETFIISWRRERHAQQKCSLLDLHSPL